MCLYKTAEIFSKEWNVLHHACNVNCKTFIEFFLVNPVLHTVHLNVMQGLCLRIYAHVSGLDILVDVVTKGMHLPLHFVDVYTKFLLYVFLLDP